MMIMIPVCTKTTNFDFLLVAHWNNSLWIYILLHLYTLYDSKPTSLFDYFLMLCA